MTAIFIRDITVRDNMRHIDPDHVNELAWSMSNDGQIVPIQVSMNINGYVLKAGHHRLEAAKKLGWDLIDAIIEEPFEDDAERLMFQAVENTARKNLTVMDKAKVYSELVNQCGWKQVDVARRFNISPTDVSLGLSLVHAHPKIQQAVEEGRIAPSAVEPVITQPIEIQDELADAVIQAKTVRKVKSLLDAHLAGKELVKTKASSNTGNPLDEFFLNELIKAHVAIDNASMAVPNKPIDTAILYNIREHVDKILDRVERVR